MGGVPLARWEIWRGPNHPSPYTTGSSPSLSGFGAVGGWEDPTYLLSTDYVLSSLLYNLI